MENVVLHFIKGKKWWLSRFMTDLRESVLLRISYIDAALLKDTFSSLIAAIADTT